MQLTYLLDGRNLSPCCSILKKKRFFHKSNYINQKGVKIHVRMK